MTTADALRVLAVIVGGVSFSIGAFVIRTWVHRLDSYGQLAAKLFGIVHLLVVLFIAATLADHAHEPLSWWTPAALVIFSLKIACLMLVLEIQRDAYLRDDPPKRRATDKT